MLDLDQVVLTLGSFQLQASWSLEAGERVAVIGPSGSGKSTLLLAIAGFVMPMAGRICWSGADLGGASPGARPVSILFQDQNLFPHLTVRQNLGLGISTRLRFDAAQESQIANALERVGLAGLGAARPSELSGGQQGRAALARALLRARPILLLDEPFAALGPALKAEMLELVVETAEENGTLVMMVTHDPEDARRFGRKTVLMEDGVALPPVQTDELFANPPAGLRKYLGA
jgi:thiamine transport system ATP-binding protein